MRASPIAPAVPFNGHDRCANRSEDRAHPVAG
jgi:hypothetical protein